MAEAHKTTLSIGGDTAALGIGRSVTEYFSHRDRHNSEASTRYYDIKRLNGRAVKRHAAVETAGSNQGGNVPNTAVAISVGAVGCW